MNKFKIAIIRKNLEDVVVEWNTVPRIGEVIETGDSQHHFSYVITNVIHYVRRGIGSDDGEIGLEVTERK
jgi:hypothetical protein